MILYALNPPEDSLPSQFWWVVVWHVTCHTISAACDHALHLPYYISNPISINGIDWEISIIDFSAPSEKWEMRYLEIGGSYGKMKSNPTNESHIGQFGDLYAVIHQMIRKLVWFKKPNLRCFPKLLLRDVRNEALLSISMSKYFTCPI